MPFFGEDHLNGFIDGCLKIKRMDFLPLVERLSQELVDHGKKMADDAGAPFHIRQGKSRKDEFVRDIIRERKLREGLVTVLQCQETCTSVKLIYGQGRPRIIFTRRPQRVLYYYFLDPQFGLMGIRIQTWFPFTVQVYINGHHWLARQLHAKGIDFVQQDNAFTQFDNPSKAQKIADRFPHLPWVTILGRWAKLVNPLLRTQPWLARKGYHWVIDQAEFSSDLLFRSRDALRPLYAKLLNHACLQKFWIKLNSDPAKVPGFKVPNVDEGDPVKPELCQLYDFGLNADELAASRKTGSSSASVWGPRAAARCSNQIRKRHSAKSV